MPGDLGVCLSTGGPGLIHMLNGMYDAKLERSKPSSSSALSRDPDARVHEQMKRQDIRLEDVKKESPRPKVRRIKRREARRGRSRMHH